VQEEPPLDRAGAGAGAGGGGALGEEEEEDGGVAGAALRTASEALLSTFCAPPRNARP
jgi:hypothetical protein